MAVSLAMTAAMTAAPFLLLITVPTNPTAPTVPVRLLSHTSPESSGEVRDAAIDHEEEVASTPAPPDAATPTTPPTTATTPTTTVVPVTAAVAPAAPSTTTTTVPELPVAPAAAPVIGSAPSPEPVAEEPPVEVVTGAATVAEAAPAAAHIGSNSQSGMASWYDTKPSSCSHRTIPRGATVHVVNVGNGKHTSCVVEGYGPTDTSRVIDMSRTTFSHLADPSQGIVPVRLEW